MRSEADFEQLFFQYWTRIYSLLFRLTGSADEAEDLALETFWRYWQRPPRDNGSTSGWLYRVASNLGYNALRSARRRQAYELRAVQDDALDPAQEAETSQQRERVRRVLRSLPERQAKLLVLRHSGLSYKEISAVLEMPVSSVGALLVRAEQNFLKHYESEDEHASER
jgi:RNA polymerase sigma-70 factor, ECF subfamily